jgi:hypothetical protein
MEHEMRENIKSETISWRFDCKGEGTPRKLTTATQPQFLRRIADFKHAAGFQISRCTLRKRMFD